jgi:hypothetical protein
VPAGRSRVLVLVLTGALGLGEGTAEPAASGEPDSGDSGEDGPAGPAATATGPAVLSEGAALLIADLLAAAGAPLAGYLDAALAELERAETIEMP